MDSLKEALKTSQKTKITCQEAHEMAERFNISPLDLGRLLDELQIKIIGCQLGLFGYGEKKKDIPQITSPDPDIVDAIKASVKGNKISCKTAWEIADGRKIQRKMVAGHIESLGIKITDCQLGAF
jgi:hypothetical protein